jgi:hypothetical protein
VSGSQRSPTPKGCIDSLSFWENMRCHTLMGIMFTLGQGTVSGYCPWGDRALAAAVARDKIANVLLAYKGKNNHGGAARAAEDIARQTARELLGPLLDTACSRLALVIRRVFDIAVECSAAGASKAQAAVLIMAYTGCCCQPSSDQIRC